MDFRTTILRTGEKQPQHWLSESVLLLINGPCTLLLAILIIRKLIFTAAWFLDTFDLSYHAFSKLYKPRCQSIRVSSCLSLACRGA